MREHSPQPHDEWQDLGRVIPAGSCRVAAALAGLLLAFGLCEPSEALETEAADGEAAQALAPSLSAKSPRVSAEQQQEWSAGEPGAAPQLASRSMLWVGQGRRLQWGLGVGSTRSGSLNLPSPLQPPAYQGPQGPQQAVWAGVRMNLTRDLAWSVETPLQAEADRRPQGMRFERPRDQGLAGLRGALRYQLSRDSQIIVKPRARRVSVTYTASW